MNLKQLEAFVQVAEGGSFSRAAKELFLTQPTISAHVSSLEKELNDILSPVCENALFALAFFAK